MMQTQLRTLALLLALLLPVVANADGPVGLKLRWENSFGHGNEWLLAFSKDGKVAYFDQPSGRILARDTTTWMKTGKLLVNADDLKRKDDVVVTTSDGRYRAYAVESYEKKTRGWGEIIVEDAKTKAVLARTTVHRKYPKLLLSRDGKTLISASFDAINVWEVPTLKKKASLGPPGSNVRGMVLSHDGQTLGVTCGAAGPEDQIWDVKTGKLRLVLGAGGGVQLWSLSFSRDGKTLVSSGNDSMVRLWDAATGRNRRVIALEADSRTQPATLSPDGKMIAAGEGPLVRLFDATTAKPLFDLKGHTSVVRALAFSPDGKQLVSASGNRVNPREKGLAESEPGEAIVWDLATRKARFACKRHGLGTYAVAWSPDGKRIATAGPARLSTFGVKVDADRAVNLWDARTGKQVEEFPVRARDGVTGLSFSLDGKYLLADGFLLDARTGKELRRFHGSAFAFSKDGKALAAVGGGAIEVWSPDTGKRFAWHVPKGAPHFNAVAFHPDGKSVAVAGSDGVIWMWDIVAGKK
jgi:WD40 repeat protein